MFGFFKRKALKKRAFNLFSTLNLIHRLIATGLVEEYELVDVVCYRAVNVPIYLDDTSPPSIITDYVKRAIGRVDFKGLA
ncbi:TPA: hypothetical protein NGS17_000206 [Vibrio parahaemolyticus]|nr:hypothetical protein [Vibrio parahaemolyticus]HCE1773647.1 hypothetical protein [Vibrio parahaemolyticus]